MFPHRSVWLSKALYHVTIAVCSHFLNICTFYHCHLNETFQDYFLDKPAFPAPTSTKLHQQPPAHSKYCPNLSLLFPPLRLAFEDSPSASPQYLPIVLSPNEGSGFPVSQSYASKSFAYAGPLG